MLNWLILSVITVKHLVLMLQITCAENFMRVMPRQFVPKNRQVIHVIWRNILNLYNINDENCYDTINLYFAKFWLLDNVFVSVCVSVRTIDSLTAVPIKNVT